MVKNKLRLRVGYIKVKLKIKMYFESVLGSSKKFSPEVQHNYFFNLHL